MIHSLPNDSLFSPEPDDSLFSLESNDSLFSLEPNDSLFSPEPNDPEREHPLQRAVRPRLRSSQVPADLEGVRPPNRPQSHAGQCISAFV